MRESAGPVLANTQYQSACTTPDIQHFVPLSTQSSPSRTALVRMPTTSLPACGSESPNPARCVAGGDRARTYCCFCASLPAISTGPVGQPREQQHQRGRVRVLGDLFDREREPEDPGSPAAVLLRDHEAEQARVAEHLEEVLRVRGGRVDLAGPGRHLLLRQLADRRLQLAVLGRKVERHRAAAY